MPAVSIPYMFSDTFFDISAIEVNRVIPSTPVVVPYLFSSTPFTEILEDAILEEE